MIHHCQSDDLFSHCSPASSFLWTPLPGPFSCDTSFTPTYKAFHYTIHPVIGPFYPFEHPTVGMLGGYLCWLCTQSHKSAAHKIIKKLKNSTAVSVQFTSLYATEVQRTKHQQKFKNSTCDFISKCLRHLSHKSAALKIQKYKNPTAASVQFTSL